jgi:hypothetical protein
MLPNASDGLITLLDPTVSFLHGILLVLHMFSLYLLSLLHALSITFSILETHFSHRAATSPRDRIPYFCLTNVITYVDLRGKCPGWSIGQALRTGPRGKKFETLQTMRG